MGLTYHYKTFEWQNNITETELLNNLYGHGGGSDYRNSYSRFYYLNIGSNVKDYLASGLTDYISLGEWHQLINSSGFYTHDREGNLYSIYIDGVGRINFDGNVKVKAFIKTYKDGANGLNWKGLADYFGENGDSDEDGIENGLNFANGLATFAGLLALAKYGIKWNNLGHTATYAKRASDGTIITAKELTLLNRADALVAAKWFKNLGRFAGYLSVGIYTVKALRDFNNGNYIDGTGNLISAGMGVVMIEGGLLGLYMGTVYTIINETIGWREMGRRQYQIMQNNPNWWHVYAR